MHRRSGWPSASPACSRRRERRPGRPTASCGRRPRRCRCWPAAAHCRRPRDRRRRPRDRGAPGPARGPPRRARGRERDRSRLIDLAPLVAAQQPLAARVDGDRPHHERVRAFRRPPLAPSTAPGRPALQVTRLSAPAAHGPPGWSTCCRRCSGRRAPGGTTMAFRTTPRPGASRVCRRLRHPAGRPRQGLLRALRHRQRLRGVGRCRPTGLGADFLSHYDGSDVGRFFGNATVSPHFPYAAGCCSASGRPRPGSDSMAPWRPTRQRWRRPQGDRPRPHG